eukprot:COSAG01_NODE_16_length_40091_cov_15.728646_49_plen_67_part_00
MAEVLIDSRRPDEQRHLRTAGGVEHRHAVGQRPGARRLRSRMQIFMKPRSQVTGIPLEFRSCYLRF